MIHLVVVGEGQTEETFIREVLSPHLVDCGVLTQPRLIRTSSSSSGGALSWDRVRLFLRNTLRERRDTYVSTLFDLYALDTRFPGVAAASGLSDPLVRAVALESDLAASVVAEAGCRPERFIPHLQPYEFESLLFADVGALPSVYPEWQAFVEPLRRAREAVLSPEHINDGLTTHPAARLGILSPHFDKVLHGPGLAAEVGLDNIRAECSHFGAWLTRLETLAPLVAEV